MVNFCPLFKILDQSNLKAFADDKLKVIQIAEFVLDRIENIVGKEEDAGYQDFSFPTMFSKGFFFRVVKSWDRVVKR